MRLQAVDMYAELPVHHLLKQLLCIPACGTLHLALKALGCFRMSYKDGTLAQVTLLIGSIYIERYNFFNTRSKFMLLLLI